MKNFRETLTKMLRGWRWQGKDGPERAEYDSLAVYLISILKVCEEILFQVIPQAYINCRHGWDRKTRP
jgi:hypothetical protein